MFRLMTDVIPLMNDVLSTKSNLFSVSDVIPVNIDAIHIHGVMQLPCSVIAVNLYHSVLKVQCRISSVWKLCFILKTRVDLPYPNIYRRGGICYVIGIR